MGDPAAGGALGPELPDLVVLEVEDVAEIGAGQWGGGLGCSKKCAVAAQAVGEAGHGVAPVSCGVME